MIGACVVGSFTAATAWSAVPGLGFRLFLQPLPFDRFWMWFLIPMVAAISIVYKTIKIEDLTQLPRAAGLLALQIVVFMLISEAVLWITIRLVSM